MKRDYYEILGVTKETSPESIKRSYRHLAMRYHPDRNPDNPAAEDKFKEATEAYTVLSDSEKRKRYDRMGHAAFESDPSGFDPTDFSSVGEMLEGLFGDVFRTNKKRKSGRDLTYQLDVTFEEAALGAEKTITINRPGPCLTCSGTGAKAGTPVRKCSICGGRGEVKFQRGFLSNYRTCHGCHGRGHQVQTPCEPCKGRGTTERTEELNVKVPAGVKSGAVRTVRDAGEVTPSGAGDLHVHIHVADHDIFTLVEADITCNIPITFPQATLGANVDVPTLEGMVSMKIPPGTQSGTVFRLRGKGIPVYGGYGKGDQLVTVIVEIPKTLNRQQRKLITELGQTLGEASHPMQSTFLGKLRALID